MADTIPLRYAQSLLRLAPMAEEQLRQELTKLNLPLVLLQSRAPPDARIAVDDYGRLFISLVQATGIPPAARLAARLTLGPSRRFDFSKDANS